MSEQEWRAVTPYDGRAETIGALSLSGESGQGLVAITPPQDGETALAAALQSGFGLAWPEPGQSTLAGEARLMGMAADQALLLFPHEGAGAVAHVRDRLGETAWLTDQSDAWALLRLAGPTARRALARICMLDLHPDAFAPGAAQRTLIEHMSVIILHEAADVFLLMSPTSSAESFFDAVATSARNILPAD